jgi:transposase
VAKGYRPVVRDQGFLLPPDMRDWLPADHQVWLLIAVVSEHLDTTAFHAQRRTGGVGKAGYDPDMLLTLLIWAYSQGVRSSRRIERLCRQDIAFRIICGGNLPDHTTIARFRAEFADAVTEMFTQVLVLCARLGMGALATITLDGTKLTANASKSANRQRQWLAEHAARAVAEHAATDAEQDTLWGIGNSPDTVPTDLQPDEHGQGTGHHDDHDGGSGDGGAGDGSQMSPARRRGRTGRAARIAQALAEVQAEEAERAERRRVETAKSEQYLRDAVAGTLAAGPPPLAVRVQAARATLARVEAAHQKKIDSWKERVAARNGRALQGLPPRPMDDCARIKAARERLARAEREQTEREQAEAQAGKDNPVVRNITDPDSRLMPTRSGFAQAYNTQSIVSADGLILATALTQTPGDVTWFRPMTVAAEHAAALVNATHVEHATTHDLSCTCPQADPAPRTAGPTPATPTRGPNCRRHPDDIGVLAADAGYLSEDNLTAPGPDRLIAVGKHRDLVMAAATNPATGQPPPDDPVAQMAHRLRTPDGIATYNQRGHIAETPHGHIKHNLGFRQFSMRGLTKTAAEWTFVCAIANLLKALPASAPTLTLPTE